MGMYGPNKTPRIWVICHPFIVYILHAHTHTYIYIYIHKYITYITHKDMDLILVIFGSVTGCHRGAGSFDNF